MKKIDDNFLAVLTLTNVSVAGLKKKFKLRVYGIPFTDATPRGVYPERSRRVMFLIGGKPAVLHERYIIKACRPQRIF